MMGVDVHIGDPEALVHQLLDHHRRIVGVAEAGGGAGVAVMHPPGDGEAYPGLFPGHRPSGLEAGPGEEGGPVVDPFENRIVARTQSEKAQRSPVLSVVGLLEGGQVLGAWKRESSFWLAGRASTLTSSGWSSNP